jgi:putative ABC transport system permease protein
VPGVESAGAALNLPFPGDDILLHFNVEGQPAPSQGDQNSINYQVISPDYFRTLRIPLLSGRDIAETDRADAPPVVIISESAAKRYFAGDDPLGKRVRIGGESAPLLTIIGVASDIRERTLEAQPHAEAYVPDQQSPFGFMGIAVRTKGDPANVFGSVRGAVESVDRQLSVGSVHTMNELMSESLTRERSISLLAGFFGLAALLLASVGIYGVISYTVTQRTREIGIRVALGAKRGDVLRLIVNHGMGLALAGVAIGLLVSFVLTRALSSLLYDVSATDPLTFAGVALMLIFIALVACLIPALRATRVDPMIALRDQ